jgi:hypothetical protein
MRMRVGVSDETVAARWFLRKHASCAVIPVHVTS